MKRLLSWYMALLLLIGSIPLQASAASAAPMTGDGSEESPYVITTAEQLQGISNELNAHYVLGADIDASETVGWNGGAGFEPIGDNDSPFTGSLEGSGYTVRGLTIDRSTASYVGLFGKIQGGSVRNLILIDGDVTGRNAVGLLAGQSTQNSRIENAGATGSVTGEGLTGGLVGQHFSGEINRSFADVDVVSVNKVGGLTGENWSRIDQSYALGSVNGRTEVGGLAGRNEMNMNSTIGNSFAIGSVTGNSEVGGLVGRNVARIQQSYSAGLVTGGSSVGGLVGRAFGGVSSEEASFYDRETAGHTDGDKGTPASTAELKKRATYPAEWNFGSIWTIEEGRSYPVLQGVAASHGLDAAPPTIVGARKLHENPDRLIVTFDEEVLAPDATGVAIRADGRELTIAGIEGAGTRELVFALGDRFEPEQSVTFSYDGQTGRIADLENNGLRGVDNRPAIEVTKEDGSDYADGTWTNASVTASVYVAAGAGSIASLTYSIDGGPAQAYSGPIVVSDEGSHSLVIRVTDRAGITFDTLLAVKIDKTPPAVAFSPNGDESGAASAASAVVVGDDGSGADPASLRYAWSVEPSAPATGWAPFASGETLGHRGASGSWILHIRASDLAGNSSAVSSSRFRIAAPYTGSGSSGGGSSLPGNVHLIGVDGGTVRFDGGRIVFPAGAFERPFYLTVDQIVEGKGLPLADGQLFASNVFSFQKDQPGEFSKPFTVVLRLTGGTTGDKKADYRLYWLNEDANEWTELKDLKIDEENGEISGTLDRPAKVAILADPSGQPQENGGTEAEFTDLSGHWAEENVKRLAGVGAAKGFEDGTFKPDRPISRAEFVALLVRVLGLSEKQGQPFADTAGHWAEREIAAAHAHGIVQGYRATAFAPDDPITREQMAAIVVKALGREAKSADKSFADQAAISAWAREAVAAAAEFGLLTGTPGNRMKPQAPATRGEAATVILRALENK